MRVRRPEDPVVNGRFGEVLETKDRFAAERETDARKGARS